MSLVSLQRNSFPLSTYSPGLAIGLALVLSLLIASICVHKALTIPSVEFDARCIKDRWVAHFDDAPKQGRVIKSLKSEAGIIRYIEEDIPCSAISTRTFTEFDHLTQSYERAREIASAGYVTLVFQDNSEKVFLVNPERSINTIGLTSWLILLEGILFLMIGVWVWRFDRNRVEHRLFVVASLGACLAIFSIFLAAEGSMFVSGSDFDTVVFLSRSADKLAAYSFALLLGVYPIKLIGRRTIVVTYVFLLLLIANEFFELIDIPIHTFETQFIVPVIMGLSFAFLQYRRSKGRLAARAVAKLFINSLVLSNGLVFLFYVLPGILGIGQRTSLLFSCLFMAILYVGILVGLFRYRLFDMERWWFKIWLWFISGLLVLIIDIFLISLFDFSHSTGLVISLLMASWLYFPCRQYLLEKLNLTKEITIENQFPKILESVFSTQDYNKQWKEILVTIFLPLNYQQVNEKNDEGGIIMDDGEKLSVPSLNTHQRYILSYAKNGTRLFSQNDVRTVDLFFDVFQRCCELQNIQKASTNRERERIMRDLHDDVGGKLVMLVHRLKDENRSLARDTLKSLKDSIYTLDDSAKMPLVYVLYNIQSDLRGVLGSLGVEFQWKNEDDISDHYICSPRKKVNLSKIVNEIVVNAIKHANPKKIVVNTYLGDSVLNICVRNNGTITPPEIWKPGKGLANIAARAAEIDSTVCRKLVAGAAREEEEWIETLIVIPVEEHNNGEKGSIA